MATPAQQGIQQRVLTKLIVFALLMAAVPIGTYFIALQRIFEESLLPSQRAPTLACALFSQADHSPGNTTYAALAAVLAANIVLAGYVYVAFAEGELPEEVPAGKEKKSQ
ncbi:uncharacterized protein EHS24_007697 [Apiotrichum porosum]|uniref:Vacuolar ATPase assembly integral membrane protein VMA21 n=1 Tax=Apiotrichum porosum TaxID=105984 RepID=A0A427XV43_9TREE|nr:uncharacterized protein EHS24_007697 [Apiotrichum porosum]RSH82703.1 hypothetical protein EHS24_007697 [Apiotrichum porosum]